MSMQKEKDSVQNSEPSAYNMQTLFINEDKSIFLLKVPRYLIEKISEMQDKEKIGVLDIDLNGDGTLQIENNTFLANSIPRSFHVRKTKIIPNTGFFDVDRNDVAIKISTGPEEVFYATPVVSREYLAFRKSINTHIMNRRSTTLMIDSTKEGKKLEKVSIMGDPDAMARKRKKMLYEGKRERLGKTEVMDMVFRAFEKYSNWTIRGLSHYTSQPEAYIQEILSEIAVMNKKEHKSTYELKPEYKSDLYGNTE